MIGNKESFRTRILQISCQILQEGSKESGIYGAHLRQQLTTLQKDPELINALEAVIAAEHSISLEPIVAYRLESMGLVKLNPEGATISRELYRIYFRKHLFLV
jgi:AAA-like domain